MPRYIEITINDEGEIESNVHGVLGPDCEALTQFLEELGDVVEHRRTSDYHRHQVAIRHATIGH